MSGDNVSKVSVGKCVICGFKYEGFGNNAEPVKRGKCCGVCNDLQVIPARLKYMQKAQSELSK